MTDLEEENLTSVFVEAPVDSRQPLQDVHSSITGNFTQRQASEAMRSKLSSVSDSSIIVQPSKKSKFTPPSVVEDFNSFMDILPWRDVKNCLSLSCVRYRREFDNYKSVATLFTGYQQTFPGNSVKRMKFDSLLKKKYPLLIGQCLKCVELSLEPRRGRPKLIGAKRCVAKFF